MEVLSEKTTAKSPVRSIANLPDSISKIMIYLGGTGVLAATLLVVFETVVRYRQLFPMAIAEEYGGYALVFITGFGLADALLHDTFPRISVFIKRLGERPQRIASLFAYLVTLLLIGFYFWRSLLKCIESFQLGTKSTTYLYTPLYIPQLFLVIGFAMMLVILVSLFIRNLQRILTDSKRVSDQ